MSFKKSLDFAEILSSLDIEHFDDLSSQRGEVGI